MAKAATHGGCTFVLLEKRETQVNIEYAIRGARPSMALVGEDLDPNFRADIVRQAVIPAAGPGLIRTQDIGMRFANAVSVADRMTRGLLSSIPFPHAEMTGRQRSAATAECSE
ncbi:MAG: hypothetical protein QNJ43_20900 [Breoghania sp.]|nr:hypothetical protein [Breoghania sp.]